MESSSPPPHARLKAKIILAQMSIADAATRLKIKGTALSGVLSGRALPSRNQKAQIEKHFGIPADAWHR